MPRPPIRIELRVGCLGQCAVGSPSLAGRRGPVHGGANERMAEGAPLVDLEQAGLFGRVRGLDADAQLRRSANEQERIAERLGRSEKQQLVCFGGKGLDLTPEALLDPAVSESGD